MTGVQTCALPISDTIPGNISMVDSLTVHVLATDPPTVTLEPPTPSGGALISEGLTVSMAASASSDLSVARVDFMVDDAVVKSDTSSPYTYSFTAGWVEETTALKLSAIAVDSRGISSPEDYVNISIIPDAVPPVVSFANPADGDEIVEDSTIPISATVTDNKDIASVSFYIDDLVTPVQTFTQPPYVLAYTAPLVEDSTPVVFGVSAVDSAGNNSGIVTINCSIVNDSASPQVSITQPAAGAVFSEGAPITLAAQASDNGTVEKVSFYIGTELAFEDTTEPFTYQFAAPAVSEDSSIGLGAKALDNAGNESDLARIIITVTNDEDPPEVNLALWPEGPDILDGSILELSAAVDISEIDLDRSYLTVGAVGFAEQTMLFNQDHEYTIPLVTEGTDLVVRAQAYDYAGNLTIEEETYYIRPVLSDLTTDLGSALFSSGEVAASLALSEDVLFVPAGPQGVVVLDVSDPASPAALSTAPTSDYAYAAAVAGSVLYVADGQGGLKIFDLTDPTDPIEIDTFTELDREATDLGLLDGGTLLLAARSPGGSLDSGDTISLQALSLGDLVDPVIPSEIPAIWAELMLTDPGVERVGRPRVSILVSGHGVVSAGDLAADELSLVDTAARSEMIADSAFSAATGTIITALAADEIIYAGTSGDSESLVVFDATDPASLLELASLDLTGAASDSVLAGDYLFIAAGDRGLIVVDVSTPSSPKVVGRFDIGSARGVASGGDRVFVSTAKRGLTVLSFDTGDIAPTVTITSPTDGGTLAKGAIFDIAATVTDDGPVSCGFYLNGDFYRQVSSEPYLISVRVPVPLVSGETLTIEALVTDWSGQTAADQIAVTIAADTTNPILILEGPAEAVEGSEVRVTALASDDVRISSVSLTALDWAPLTDTAVPFEFEFNVPLRSELGAPYQLEVTALALDPSFNEATARLLIDVLENTSSQIPTVEITSPPEGQGIIEGTVVWVEVTATDPDGSIARVIFSREGEQVAIDSSAPYRRSVRMPIVDGITGVEVAVVAVDAMGNESIPDTVTLNVIDDTIDPEISLSTSPGSSAIFTGSKLLIEVAASDNISLATVATVLTIDGDVFLSSSDSSIEYTVPQGHGGEVLTVTATAFDRAGNTKVTERSFLIETLYSSITVTGQYSTVGPASDIVIDGETVYVAEGFKGLGIYDLTDPDLPSLIGYVDTPGEATAVFLKGDNAYIADGTYGLVIADISTPAAASIVGSRAIAGTAVDVVADGDYSYVSLAGSVVQIDIRNPSSPILADTFAAGSFAVDIDDSKVFIARSNGTFSVNNAAAVSGVLGTVSTSGAEGIALSEGDIAYIARGENGISSYSVSGSTPSHLSTAVFDGAPDAVLSPQALLAADGYLYIAAGNSGIGIAEVIDSGEIALRARFSAPGDVKAVALGGNGRLYAACGDSGIRVLRLSERSSTSLTAGIENGDGRDVAIDGERAYLAGGNTGLYVFDISDPSDPALVTTVTTGGSAAGVEIVGDYAYVAVGFGGLSRVNTSTFEASALMDLGAVNRLAREGNRLYTAGGVIGIVNVANPAAPAILGSFGTPGASLDVDISGTIAYVADGTAGLRIYDVSDPDDVFELGSIATADQARSVDVEGTLVLVGIGGSGVEAIDVSDPELPVSLSTWSTSGASVDVTLSGRTALVSVGLWGVEMVDFSDAGNPTLIDIIDTIDYAGAARPLRGRLYVADGYGGLQVIDLAGDDIQPGVVISLPVPGTEVMKGAAIRIEAEEDSWLGAAKVEFMIDGTKVFTDFAEPFGFTTRVPASVPVGGTFAISASVTDTLGNTGSTLNPVPVTVSEPDGEAPALTLTGPDDGDTFSEGQDIAITAQATDNVDVPTVIFSARGGIVKVDTVPPYETVYSAPAVDTDTVITISARAVDGSGNIAEEEISVTIYNDDDPPTVTISAPSDGGHYPEGSNIQVAATAIDNRNVDYVEFTIDGLTTRDETSPYTVNYLLPQVAGSRELIISAIAADSAGHLSAPNSVTINVDDDAAPQVSIAAPAGGTDYNEGMEVSVTATATDDIGVDRVEFLVNDTLQATDTVPSGSTFAAAVSMPAVQGSSPEAVEIKVVAYDTSDAATTATVSVNVHTPAPPQITVDAPVDGADFIEGIQITVQATATDEVAVDYVEFFVDGGAVQATDSSSPYSGTVTLPLIGGLSTADVSARAVDVSGDSAVDTVTVDLLADQLPTAVLTAPADGSSIKEGLQLTISADATDDVSVSRVDFLIDDAVVGSDATPSGNSYSINYTVPYGTDGQTLTLKARAVDNQSQETDSATRSVTVTGDEAPVVALTAPEDASSIIEGLSLTIAATATDDVGVSRVDFYADTVLAGSDSTPGDGFTTSYAVPFGAGGSTLVIGATAYDTRAQDASAATRSVSVTEDTPPAVSLTSPDDGSSIKEGFTLDIIADASDDVGVDHVE